MPARARRLHLTFASVGYAELLGVELLSALLQQAGHRSSLVHDPALFDDRFALRLPRLARRVDRRDRVVARILALEPDLLAFSVMTSTVGWALEIARAVRRVRPIPVVMGGSHASAAPAYLAAQPEVDWVCEGEGEAALLALVEDLAAGGRGQGIPGMWTRLGTTPVPPVAPGAVVEDLDALPLPDKALYASTQPRRGMYGIMTSRGCPYRCAFCFNSQGGAEDGTGVAVPVRRRSVQGVLEELSVAQRRDPYRYVEFHDDIFTMDRRWLAAFAPAYRQRIGVPFGCSAHARCLDPARIGMLVEAGCVRVKMGVQSLDDPAYRRGVLHRTDREEDIASAIDTCRAAGLRVEVDHIVGLPGEAHQARRRALDFYRAHPPDRIGAYWFTWFPGTALTRQAVARGTLTAAEHQGILAGRTTTYREMEQAGRGDAAQDARDQGYAAALDLLPRLPAALRSRLDPDRLGQVPGLQGVARSVMAAGMLTDLGRGGGHDALAYLRWYGHHLVGAGRHDPVSAAVPPAPPAPCSAPAPGGSDPPQAGHRGSPALTSPPPPGPAPRSAAR